MLSRIEISKNVFRANSVVLLAFITINLLFEPPEAARLPPPMARIGSLVGQVELKKHGSVDWVAPQVGQLLEEGDMIRTGSYSESVLHLLGKSSVVVSANTDFVVGKDLVQRSLFELGVGQITAAIDESSGREYEFISRGSDAVASAKEGSFSMTTDGKGTVVVDSYKGEVKLRAKEKVITLKKGRRSTVRPNQVPSRDTPIPTSVTLRVNWPPTKLSHDRTTISGETSAGALVRINGILVRADQDGYFSLEADLQEGKNRLVINATDPAGNSATKSSPEIEVDTQPPTLEVNAKDLWK